MPISQFRTVIVVACLFIAGCATGADREPEPNISLVEQYVAAYNDRDVSRMADLMHQDIQWLSIEGENVDVFASGKDDLVRQMTDYVASSAATFSELEGGLVDGRFTAVREIANWTATNGEQRQQAAIAIYEIEDQLIRRVWYYPAGQAQ